MRPGDPFERALTTALIQQADERKTDEATATIRAQAILTGQVLALCLGADPASVIKVGEVLAKEVDDVD